MAADTDNGNGRVTLAVLGEKIDNITDLLHDYCDDAKKREDRIRDLERRADVNDSQHGIMATIGLALSAIASAIGAWVK